jgi:hypothetical protein
MGLLLLFSAGLLTACKTTEDVVVAVPSIVNNSPDTLYECKDWPMAPHKSAKQKDVASYIVKGHDAYLDCKYKLQTVREINNYIREKTQPVDKDYK